ncbi:unnamed protein product [Rotaria magnacalcarata]|uniref:Transposase Tc5 C-terminal domain-containing protein n=2 Tax=Rotaria magnacalcarata TaxID=392030 RepID=A0A8S3B9D8_9BILA|nr:unnamed protein product [Rotaria magnacalcarata]
MFQEARENVLPVHDKDLQRWALQKAAEDSITRHHAEDINAIIELADSFVRDAKREMQNYAPGEVLNTDQVGLELELYSNRTLSYEGEKITMARVRSKNATTHSYTIQPMISAAGKMVSPLFLCSKEPKGKMSESIIYHRYSTLIHILIDIKKILFPASNIVVTCSSSGKLTTSLVEYWRDHVLRIWVPAQFLLLSDYWPGQRSAEIYSTVRGYKRLEIPAHTTSRIQPLDVLFNRQWKLIARRMFDHVQLNDIVINLSERNNIIRVNSLIHNQLSSPLFVPMIKYSWFASGYTDQHPGPFQTVNDICFDIGNNFCQRLNCACNLLSFIQCSCCRRFLCFEHFFEAYHFHS